MALPLAAQPAGQGDDVVRPLIDELVAPVISLAPIASDGVAGEAFLRKPPGAGPFPAVILVHGGAPRWDTGTLRDFILHVHASRFLEAGYVTVAVTRRDLDLDLAADEVQPAVLDVLAVYDEVSALPYVDAGSVAVRGTSVGGYLTLEIAAAREDVAAIAVEEPFSFPFVGLSPGVDDTAMVDSSKIDRIDAPILLIRGDQTPNINEFNRAVFIPAIKASGRQLTVSTYPGQLHSFAFYDNEERTPDPAVSLQAFQEIESFFREHVAVLPQQADDMPVAHQPIKE